MNFLGRALQLLDRFYECSRQLSFLNAVKVFSYLWGSNSIKSIVLEKKCFFFQPRSDKGVMSHFYKDGYRIVGTEGGAKLIFDIGANIGDETFRFRLFHPKASIVAVEASSRNVALLNRNFQSDPNVHIFHASLWHSTGKVRLNTRNNSHESHSIAGLICQPMPADADDNMGSEEVDAMTVTDILNSLNLADLSVDIFKIDVEGAEKFIFCRGDNSWLEKVKVIIMEMTDNDLPGSFQDITQILYSANRKWESYICGENIVFIRRYSGYKLQQVVGLGR